MLLRHLIINRYLEALQKQPKLHALLEDAGGTLMAAVRLAKSDLEKAEKLDLEQLADIVTALKLLTNSDYRVAMTKQDVGIDPNNAAQLLKMLDTIPSDPAKQLPTATRDFVRSVALMSKSLRAKELDALKALISSDSSKRTAAQAELGKLASMVAAALEKLKAKVDR
jgi:hypothetical protein